MKFYLAPMEGVTDIYTEMLTMPISVPWINTLPLSGTQTQWRVQP